MNRKWSALCLAAVCCLTTAVVVGSTGLALHDASPIAAMNGSNTRRFAYRFAYPSREYYTVSLEVRRVSSPREDRFTVPSVSASLYISYDDAEAILSSAVIVPLERPENCSVEIDVLKLEDYLVAGSVASNWAIGGTVACDGVASKLTQKSISVVAKFVRLVETAIRSGG